jgi:hypothetical protein
MNKEVTVTGMQMKTKVGANLLICDDNLEASYTTKNLNQSRKALLEPVSSVTGITGSFFYTVNAKANGDAVEDVYGQYTETGSGTGTNATAAAAGKTNYDTAFNTAYGFATPTEADYGTAYGYVDYVFYLKATSDTANQEIVMTECNLLRKTDTAINDSGTAATEKDNAWRIAVFSSDITENGGKGTTGAATSVGTLDPAASTAKVILTRSGATNQSGTLAVSAKNAAPSESASYNTWNDTNLGSLGDTVGGTKYFKVTVRVWLEGEDTSCKSSTYAQLTSEYELATKIELKESDAVGVANIQSDTSKVKASDFSGT